MDNNGGFIGSTAASQVSVNEALLTTGSARSGFVQINASAGFDGTLHVASAQLGGLSLGPIGVACDNLGGIGQSTTCLIYTGAREQDHQLPVTGIEYPFTLGQAFNFSYSSSAGGSTYPSNNGGADANFQFQFRFLEADGVTPVAVEAVPEPGTFALFGVALGALTAGRCFHLRHRCFESEQ